MEKSRRNADIALCETSQQFQSQRVGVGAVCVSRYSWVRPRFGRSPRGPFVEFWWCLKRRKRAHFRAPAIQTPPKFHERTSKRGRKKEKCGGRGIKKTRNFGPPHPSGPHPSGSHPSGSHPSGLHPSRPPFGAPPSVGPTVRGPTLRGPHPSLPHPSGPPPFGAPPFGAPPFGGPHPSGPRKQPKSGLGQKWSGPKVVRLGAGQKWSPFWAIWGGPKSGQKWSGTKVVWAKSGRAKSGEMSGPKVVWAQIGICHNLDSKIQSNMLAHTKNQLADLLTKGSFTCDEWNHLSVS